ncbi:hypothetical protein [Natronomonas sp.]|uniref:hypothetical protein n=1 Tax=Natronomonas sp. TaxID=2184060 RepID=UPI002FC293AA
MTTLINGVLGGIIASAVAAIALHVLGGPRPFEVPGEENTTTVRWRVLQATLGYGAIAGLGFMIVELYVVDWLSVPPTAVEAFAAAGLWAGLMFAMSALASLVGEGQELGGFRRLLLFHLVFGVVFGIWVRMTWIT